MEDTINWTKDDVANFIARVRKIPDYSAIFIRNGVDGNTLPFYADIRQLSAIGITLLGHKIHIKLAIERLLARDL